MTEEYMTKDGCDAKHKETLELLNAINDRLFKDNGSLSIQTRLDRHEQLAKGLMRVITWLSATVLGAIILGLASLVFKTNLLGG